MGLKQLTHAASDSLSSDMTGDQVYMYCERMGSTAELSSNLQLVFESKMSNGQMNFEILSPKILANLSAQIINEAYPVGTIIMHAHKRQLETPTEWTIPMPQSSYLFCNGATVNASHYPELYQQIGTFYGSGDGTLSSFSLPNFDDRFPQQIHDLAKSPLITSGYINAGLPNIIGHTTNIQRAYDLRPERYPSGSEWGAFNNGNKYESYGSTIPGNGANDWGIGWTGDSFDASFGQADISGTLVTDESKIVYGKSDTVQPASVIVSFYIKARITGKEY